MGGRATAHGIENVINGMAGLSPRVLAHLGEAGEQATGILLDAVNKHIELTCHTLDDLAELDYPYSTRYGQDSFDTPDEFVHIQSGKLHDNVKSLTVVTDKSVICAVGVREEDVPYIKYLIEGTTKMRPRDFLGFAYQEVRDQVVRTLKYGIVEGLGSRGGRR